MTDAFPCLVFSVGIPPDHSGVDGVVGAQRRPGLLHALDVEPDAGNIPGPGSAPDLLVLASGAVTHRPLIETCAGTGLPIALRTGGADLKEVVRAVGWFHLAFRRDIPPSRPRPPLPNGSRVILIHEALGEAPCNLRAMERMGEQTCIPVGFYDNSTNAATGALAVAAGAVMILRAASPELPGYVAGIRRAEYLLGERRKSPGPNEVTAARGLRCRVIAAHDLEAGRIVTLDDLEFRSPGPDRGEFAPYQIDEIVGRALLSPAPAGKALREEILQGKAPESPPWFSPRPPRDRPV